MMKPVSTTQATGYTLTEVILAMAVMAITVPLILGLVVAGSESSRQAERETRAVITARSVFEEVRRASQNNGEFLKASDLPWGTRDANGAGGGGFGGGSIPGPGSGAEAKDKDWAILELNNEGVIVGHADKMKYEDRWEGENAQVVALAAVRGYGQEIKNVEIVPGENLNIFRVEVRIESPARAKAENRNRMIFIQSSSFK